MFPNDSISFTFKNVSLDKREEDDIGWQKSGPLKKIARLLL